MKSILIVYNQVMGRELIELLDELDIRGFTRWNDVQGRGSESGEPHMGTHTWPSLNGALLCVVEDDDVDPLLEGVEKLDDQGNDRGIRAFVWNVERSV